jgi:hypothetical protein
MFHLEKSRSTSHIKLQKRYFFLFFSLLFRRKLQSTFQTIVQQYFSLFLSLSFRRKFQSASNAISRDHACFLFFLLSFRGEYRSISHIKPQKRYFFLFFSLLFRRKLQSIFQTIARQYFSLFLSLSFRRKFQSTSNAISRDRACFLSFLLSFRGEYRSIPHIKPQKRYFFSSHCYLGGNLSRYFKPSYDSIFFLYT